MIFKKCYNFLFFLITEFGHDGTPVGVYGVKFAFFSGHFLFDIVRGKNGFKVHPASLYFDHEV
jgi:hypothetical protein